MRNWEGKCDESDRFQILNLKFYVGKGLLKGSAVRTVEYSSLCEGLEIDSGTMKEQPAQVSCLQDKPPLLLLFLLFTSLENTRRQKLGAAQCESIGTKLCL